MLRLFNLFANSTTFTILYHPLSSFLQLHKPLFLGPSTVARSAAWAPLGSTGLHWAPHNADFLGIFSVLEDQLSWRAEKPLRHPNGQTYQTISNISNISNIIYQYLPGVQKKTEFNHINNHINNHIQSNSPDKIK